MDRLDKVLRIFKAVKNTLKYFSKWALGKPLLQKRFCSICRGAASLPWKSNKGLILYRIWDFFPLGIDQMLLQFL